MPNRLRPLATAPRDGTLIRLYLAGEAEPALGHWSAHLQGWLRDGDDDRRLLQGVTGWEACRSVT